MAVSSVDGAAVKSEADLRTYLSRSLLAEYHDIQEGQVRQVATFLKSYLIEAHLPPSGVDAALRQWPFKEVEATGENWLWRLRDGKSNDYFLDARDRRFPVVHTIAHANSADPVLRRLTTGNAPGLDHFWFPSKLLSSRDLGQVIGFRFFQQRNVKGLEEAEAARQLAKELGRSEPPAFRLALTEWAGAGDDLKRLREAGFASRAALDSLSWRRYEAREEGFIHDQVWSNGKVVAYGTSWNAHLANLNALRASYAAAVSGLEQEYALRWESGLFQGEPIEIVMPFARIEDLSEFANELVSGTPPFRIWGESTPSAAGVHEFVGIDLHTGHRLQGEVREDSLRLYLRNETCGNVLMRLLVNLERHVSSEVVTSVDDLLLDPA